MFEDPPPVPADILAQNAHDSDDAEGPSAKASTWEAIIGLSRVKSTASFFAAASAAAAPPDEVIVLSAPAQCPPRSGGRLLLELRRSRQGQLGGVMAAGQRAVAGAALAAKQGSASGEAFALAVQISDNEAASVRSVPFVSAKGASRTAAQLRQLLEKPGRETDLEMYTNDVAEFSIPVVSDPSEEGLPVEHVAAVSLLEP